jgi:hypothetical protein
MTKHNWYAIEDQGYTCYECVNEGCDAYFSITNENSDEWESECPIKREKRGNEYGL